MLTDPVVFVVDDDPSVRTAISRLLVSVGLPVHSFGSAGEFLAHVGCSPAGCLILDVRMPGCSGLDLQRQLIEEGYDLPVIFISAHADVALTVRAMRAGAIQVFTKPFDDQALLDTVYEALIHDRQKQTQREELADVRRRLSLLTAREREVMTLVVTGMPNRQIASQLGTSEKTVKFQRGRVMYKMQAPSLAELVRMADRLTVAGDLAPWQAG
jgi:FixJ family two-component response regulator